MEHGGWQSQARREAQRIWVQQQEREGDGRGLWDNREGHLVFGKLECRRMRGTRRCGSRCKREFGVQRGVREKGVGVPRSEDTSRSWGGESGAGGERDMV